MLKKIILSVLDEQKQNIHGGMSPHATPTAGLQARCWLIQWQWPCTTTFCYICSYLDRISQFNGRATKVACRILPGERLMTPTAAKGLIFIAGNNYKP